MAAEDEDPVAAFSQELDTLVINSKPMITMLTMLADDYKEAYAGRIADCIEERIYAVQSVDKKLPTLYLVDSICKGLCESSTYVSLFQKKIVRIFTHTFERANDKTRVLLHKLRQTWNEVFSPEVLHSLDVAVHRLDPGWPVVAPNRNSNRSVLPPSSASTSSTSSATAQPSPLTKWPIPKLTRTVSSVASATSKAAAALTTAASTLAPPSREMIEQQLQAVRNQQIELQLHNDLLQRTMNASANSASTSTSGNSPPEVVSSSTNNNSNRQQQTTVSPRKGINTAGAASKAAKRGRNVSPSDNGKKPRRRASSPDSHHQQQQSSNRPSGHQRSPGGKSSASESPGNRRTSRDDRRAPISPRARKSSSSASNAAELLPPPPAPDSVIPLGSSHHVSVSKRVIKPTGSSRNAEGSAIVAAIRSHRKASPPPRNQRSQHSRGGSSPQRNSTSERMTFNIPRKQQTPPPLLPVLRTKEEEEGGGAFSAMDADYRTAFGLPAPMVKAESGLPPAFQQSLATSPPPPTTSLSPTVLMAPLAPQLQLPPETFQPTAFPPSQPLQPSLPVATIAAPVPLSSTTASSTPVQALLTEPHGSVVLFINAELARLFYLDQVTAVVVKAHPDTPFDTLVSWAPSVLEPRQVFFAGPTTYVYVDEGTSSAQTLCLEFSRVHAPMAFSVRGAPHQQHTIQLGLPARELVLNGAVYTIAFGGEPISVFLGEAAGYHTFRLSDSRPHLQFSEEVRYDLWSRLVDDSKVKAGLPPMGVAFPVMNSTVVAAPTVQIEAPAQPQAPAAQPLESPDLNSLLSKLTAAGLISNPPPSVLAAAAASTTPAEPVVNPLPQPMVPAALPPLLTKPTPALLQPKTSLPPLPPVPTSHHPNGRRKTKRERRIDRQRYRAALRYHQQQAQLAAMQAQVARTAPQQTSKPQPPKRYLPLEVAALKAVHPFPVEQLYSGTPCTNCSLRFGEDALKVEEGKKSSRYARHLDWHFRQNRRLKAKPSTSSTETSSSSTSSRGGRRGGGHHSKTTAATTSSATISTAAAAQRRAWYYPLDLWILYKEVNDDLEEEAAAAAAFFDANASASAAAGFSATSSASGALLATLASFDWGSFRESIQPYEAFMEVVNSSHATTAAGAEAEAIAAKCAQCTVVAESSSITEITCALCKEVLEQKWGEEEEEWRVENAVRFTEEKVATEDQENPEESPKQEVVVGKIYHPLCLKDHLVAKERAKQEQLKEEEAADDEEDDEEDEELDEELDDLELDISLTAISEDQLNSSITTTAADNSLTVKEDEKEEVVDHRARVLIPGLDISLRSSTDNDEEVSASDQTKEKEKMDVDETSAAAAAALTSTDDQQETEEKETNEEQVIVKEEAMEEEEEDVPREIEVKVFEFEIPIAATSTSTSSYANTSTSTSTTVEQLFQLTKEEENTTAATSSSSSSEPPPLLEQSSVDTNCSDDQQLSKSETSLPPPPPASSHAGDEHLFQNSTDKLSTEPQLPLPSLKRGGLVINFAKTTTAPASVSSQPAASTSTDFVDSAGTSASASATDQSSNDNKVEGGHVIKCDDEDRVDEDGGHGNRGDDHQPENTDHSVAQSTPDDTGRVLQSIALNIEHPAKGGVIGSLSLTSDHSHQSPPSPSSSKSPSCEAKAEGDATSKPGGPVEAAPKEASPSRSGDPNYYSRGVEMSSLCSIM